MSSQAVRALVCYDTLLMCRYYYCCGRVFNSISRTRLPTSYEARSDTGMSTRLVVRSKALLVYSPSHSTSTPRKIVLDEISYPGCGSLFPPYLSCALPYKGHEAHPHPTYVKAYGYPQKALFYRMMYHSSSLRAALHIINPPRTPVIFEDVLFDKLAQLKCH